MLEFDKDYVPLFLQVNESMTSYIIDNTFIGSTRFGGCEHYPYRAFTLLMKLFQNDPTRDVFPERLQEILDTDFNISKHFYHDLLVGEEDQGIYHYGITLDMQITDDSLASIQLDNIRYYHGRSFFPLNRVITLTPHQAFYLFSNILLSDRCFMFDHIYHAKDLLETSLSDFTTAILKTDKWRSDRFGKAYTILNQFSFEYLLHLKTEISNNLLSPAALLHFNGATVLGFIKHLPPIDRFLTDILSILKNPAPCPFNRQVLYYSLLYNSMSNTSAEDKVFRFLDDHTITSKNFYDRTIAKEFLASDSLTDF